MKQLLVPIYITLFLAGVTTVWYFGHHRPAQKVLKTGPTKVYKTTTPITLDAQTIKQPRPASVRDEHSPETNMELTAPQAAVTIDSIPESRDTVPTDVDLHGTDDAADQSIPVSSEQESSAREHSHDETVSKQRREDTADLLEEAAQMQKEAHMALANQLGALSVEKQVQTLQQMRAAIFNGPHPLTGKALSETPDQAEEAWTDLLNGMIQSGYIPPRDFE